jgi:hypothetical protein
MALPDTVRRYRRKLAAVGAAVAILAGAFPAMRVISSSVISSSVISSSPKSCDRTDTCTSPSPSTSSVSITPSPTPTATTPAPSTYPSPTASPCTGTAVAPGTGTLTNTLVQGKPEGTTFCLAPGLYNVTAPVLARNFDSFIGPGALLDFGNVAMSYGLYGYGGSTGQHGVTVKGIRFRNCRCSVLKTGDNWSITDVELFFNDIGLENNTGSLCLRCYIHDNRIYGVTGNGTIDGGEIAFNGGTPDPGGSTGGSKFVHLVHIMWKNSYVHDNRGPGIWCDGCWKGSTMLVENNRIENNLGPGIFFEISWGSSGGGYMVARNNTLKGNASRDGIGKSCFHAAQIEVQNSEGVEITGNTIDSSNGANAICASDTVRSDAYPTYPEHVTPFTATGNMIKVNGAALVGEDGFQGGYTLDSSTFVVDGNIYTSLTPSASHFSFYTSGSSLTFTAWQLFGFDHASTMGAGMGAQDS